MKYNKLSINLKVLYVTEFGALACFFPFLTYYFQERGLSYTEIGITYAIYSLIGVITQPIWGYVTDKYTNKRTTIIITMILSSFIIYNFIFAKSFYYIILSIILFLSFQSSIIPISDAYSYEIIEHNKDIQYGKIRLMGSLGYAIASLFCGQIIKYLGINSGFFLYSIIILIGAIFVYRIEFKGKTTSKAKVKFYDIINLVKDKRFFVFMLSIVIANVSLGSNSSYISLLIQKTGGDVTKLGTLWFIVAISELPVLFFGTKLLRKYGELNLFILGMGLFSLRYFLDSICTSYTSVLVIQIMQGVTYPFFLMSSLQYLNKITPAKVRTSAMTLYTAVCGIGTFFGNIGSGMLLEQISIFMLYKILSFTCIICLFVVVILKNINIEHNKQTNGIPVSLSCAGK